VHEPERCTAEQLLGQPRVAIAVHHNQFGANIAPE
jgi:hypothetical protein